MFVQKPKIPHVNNSNFYILTTQNILTGYLNKCKYYTVNNIEHTKTARKMFSRLDDKGEHNLRTISSSPN